MFLFPEPVDTRILYKKKAISEIIRARIEKPFSHERSILRAVNVSESEGKSSQA